MAGVIVCLVESARVRQVFSSGSHNTNLKRRNEISEEKGFAISAQVVVDEHSWFLDYS